MARVLGVRLARLAGPGKIRDEICIYLFGGSTGDGVIGISIFTYTTATVAVLLVIMRIKVVNSVGKRAIHVLRHLGELLMHQNYFLDSFHDKISTRIVQTFLQCAKLGIRFAFGEGEVAWVCKSTKASQSNQSEFQSLAHLACQYAVLALKHDGYSPDLDAILCDYLSLTSIPDVHIKGCRIGAVP